VFILVYTNCAHWWASPIGRAIVAIDTAIAPAMLPTTIGLDFGASVIASPLYTWLTVYGSVSVITLWRAWIVIRI